MTFSLSSKRGIRIEIMDQPYVVDHATLKISFFRTRDHRPPAEKGEIASVPNALWQVETRDMGNNEVWDRVWAREPITSDYSLKYLDFMSRVEQGLPAGSQILEAGCGTGQTLSCFSRRHETCGLDLSRRALQLCRARC